MSGVVACVLTVSQDPWFWARIDDRVGLRGVNWVVGGEEVRVAFRGRHEHALREIWLRQLRTSGTGVLHHFSIRHDQSSPCPPRRTRGAQRSRHGRFRARPRTGKHSGRTATVLWQRCILHTARMRPPCVAVAWTAAERPHPHPPTPYTPPRSQSFLFQTTTCSGRPGRSRLNRCSCASCAEACS